MADIWSREKRSEVMSKIKGHDTKPELAVRSLLHRMGYRFTVHAPNNRKLPGRPDIVLPKYNTVIFVHGCFWHRHKNCKIASTPKTRENYWQEKFAANVARDKRNTRKLRHSGWHVLVVWECEVAKEDKLAAKLEHKIVATLQ